MTVKEFKLLIQNYENQVLKTGKQSPISKKQMTEISQSKDNIPPEYREAFRRAEAKNYSQFDSLPLILKTYLGLVRVGEFHERFGNNPSLENNEVKSYLKEHAIDVSLRAGISVEKNSKDEAKRNTAEALDTFMNTCVMQSTIMPPTEEQKQELKTSLGENEANLALAKDLKRQRVLAKTYFLAQLGKYDILDDNGISRRFNQPLSETLVHGSRTNFILPSGADTQQVIDAYMGAHDRENPVIEERLAATHHVKRRAVRQNGIIKSETKESRTYSPLKIFGHQYGMDLSVGGIGKIGPDGRVISGNGETGHAYMRIENGDEKHCASLLFGIEGSAPGKESTLGHAHGTSGVSANQSAFFADKQIVGAKNGGRQVDLSGLDANVLADLLKEFDEKYAELQKNAGTQKGREALAELNDKLMGKLMDRAELTKMCENLGIGGERLYSTVHDARRGYLSKVNPFGMDAHAFRQSIRATMSQEAACDLAQKRFEKSDDIRLAVGAIRELICTHEARGFLWRLRHPIKNYRENATINDLTKRLKTEMGFTSQDIASAMNAPTDSFSLNWGEGLSNDRVTCSFLENSNNNFVGKSTLGPIQKATQRLVNKFYGEVNGIEASKERMKQEMKQMQADFDNEDMNLDEEDFSRAERNYLNRDEFKEEAPEEEDPEAEFRKTSPRYTAVRERLHLKILNDYYTDFANVKSEKVSPPAKDKKEPEKKI